MKNEVYNIRKRRKKAFVESIEYKHKETKMSILQKVDYDYCGIMPPTDKRRKATIICDSLFCTAEYLTKIEEK